MGVDTNSQLFGSVRFKPKGGDHIQMSGVLINCASGPTLDYAVNGSYEVV